MPPMPLMETSWRERRASWLTIRSAIGRTACAE